MDILITNHINGSKYTQDCWCCIWAYLNSIQWAKYVLWPRNRNGKSIFDECKLEGLFLVTRKVFSRFNWNTENAWYFLCLRPQNLYQCILRTITLPIPSITPEYFKEIPLYVYFKHKPSWKKSPLTFVNRTWRKSIPIGAFWLPLWGGLFFLNQLGSPHLACLFEEGLGFGEG